MFKNHPAHKNPKHNARIGKLFIAITASFSFVFGSTTAASAATSLSYNFNTAGQIATNFNSYISSGSPTQSATGGIGNTGSLSITTSDSVFATKSQFSMGPIGATYSFVSYLKSVGNSGYSGMGFTVATPGAGTAGGYPYRPNDALGVSVHGGGYVFHDGTNPNSSGSWSGGGGTGVTTVRASSNSELLNTGSPDDWYKFVLIATRDSLTTMDLRVEIWPCLANGTLIDNDADNSTPVEATAIYEFNDRNATSLIDAPAISAYFNLSGTRVYNYDNFSVNLGGGATVVEPGFPVVLTTGADADTSIFSFSGNVTSIGSDTLTGRGFAYSTNRNPTIADTVVTEAANTGTYSGNSGTIADGTYYVRAYATNSYGTSYGSEWEVVVTGGVGTGTEMTEGGGEEESADPPGSPTDSAATLDGTTATIEWSAPGSGGAPTSYTVTSEPDGLTCTVDAPATSCEIEGLTPGQSYNFTVIASNSDGDSDPSEPSNSVTVEEEAEYDFTQPLTVYFYPITAKLTDQSKTDIAAYVNSGYFTTASCVGSTQGSKLITWLAKDRAKSACNYAKSIMRKMKTKVSVTKTTGVSSDARSVLLTFGPRFVG